MNSRIFRVAPALAAVCGAALLAIAPSVVYAAENAGRAELEKELAEARAELDKAAREVAEISRQLYGGESGDVMRFVNSAQKQTAEINIPASTKWKDLLNENVEYQSDKSKLEISLPAKWGAILKLN